MSDTDAAAIGAAHGRSAVTDKETLRTLQRASLVQVLPRTHNEYQFPNVDSFFTIAPGFWESPLPENGQEQAHLFSPHVRVVNALRCVFLLLLFFFLTDHRPNTELCVFFSQRL